MGSRYSPRHMLFERALKAKYAKIDMRYKPIRQSLLKRLTTLKAFICMGRPNYVIYQL